MTMLEEATQAADRWSDEMIALRRKIHEHPELAFEAHETATRVHACGHDAHTAIVLGVAAMLSDMRDDFGGRVMFVFEPAEETLTGAALRTTSRKHIATLTPNASPLKKRAGRSQEESGVCILFVGDDAVPCGRTGSRPALNSCEITVRPCGRTLKRRRTRRRHITSLHKEDGHVQTLR